MLSVLDNVASARVSGGGAAVGAQYTPQIYSMMKRAFRGNYLDRRYSDDELRRIFHAAAKSEVRSQLVDHPTSGYTIADLRDIAAEVGIDPDAIEKAAADLVASNEPSSHSQKSPFDHVIHEDLIIARALSDAEMRAVVMQTETIIGRVGTMREADDWVEWRDPKDRFYVGLARGRGQTRIRVIGDYSVGRVNSAAGIGVIGAMTVMTVAASATAIGLIAGALCVSVVPFLVAGHWRRHRLSSQDHLREL
jgi:hypothetical protein